MSELVQIMAWRWTSDRWQAIIWSNDVSFHRRIYTSPGLNELTNKYILIYMCISHCHLWATTRTYAGLSAHTMRIYLFIQRGLFVLQSASSTSSKHSRQKTNRLPVNNGMSVASVKYDIRDNFADTTSLCRLLDWLSTFAFLSVFESPEGFYLFIYFFFFFGGGGEGGWATKTIK